MEGVIGSIPIEKTILRAGLLIETQDMVQMGPRWWFKSILARQILGPNSKKTTAFKAGDIGATPIDPTIHGVVV
jgi:hypothetical protein